MVETSAATATEATRAAQRPGNNITALWCMCVSDHCMDGYMPSFRTRNNPVWQRIMYWLPSLLPGHRRQSAEGQRTRYPCYMGNCAGANFYVDLGRHVRVVHPQVTFLRTYD